MEGHKGIIFFVKLRDPLMQSKICGQSPQVAFKLFLTYSIVQQIADCTNLEVSHVVSVSFIVNIHSSPLSPKS